MLSIIPFKAWLAGGLLLLVIIGYQGFVRGIENRLLDKLEGRQRKLDAHADKVIDSSRQEEVENRDRRRSACKEGREKECVDRIINSGLH